MSEKRIARNVVSLLAVVGSCVQAQSHMDITVTAADIAAGHQPVPTSPYKTFLRASNKSAARPRDSFQSRATVAPSLVYPLDMSNFGGPTLHNFEAHNVFVNAVAMPGGVYGQSISGPSIDDADTFLTHLFASQMIHIVDQYTGTPDQGGSVGKSGILHYNSSATTYNSPDLQTLVHAAARAFGSGPQHVLNLFYNQGIDICDVQGDCYSPDNLSTWTFCAYHSYYDFPDLGRVFFTMQPYANVQYPFTPQDEVGCRVPAGGVHSQAIESMASALSHETFEAITDPAITGWGQGFIGYEMADMCVYLEYDIPLAGSTYRLQGEYSNRDHACVWRP